MSTQCCGVVRQRAGGRGGRCWTPPAIRGWRGTTRSRCRTACARARTAGHAVGRFADAARLGRDAEPRPVHERHDVLDEPLLPLADEPAGGVGELEFAGRAAVDAEFVLEPADAHALAPLDEEEAQAAAVGDVRFAAGHDQQDVAAPVGDEPLHAVDAPRAVVGCSVAVTFTDCRSLPAFRLGEDHRAGLAPGGHLGQELVLDGLVGEGVDGLADALQAVEVHQRGVGAADDVVGHREHHVRAVRPPYLYGSVRPMYPPSPRSLSALGCRACRSRSRRR
jgi:hypothetical protein